MNIHDYMQLGIVHFMAFPETIRGEGPILETVKRIVYDKDFDAIEVTWIKDDIVRKDIAELIKNSKINVCYGAQPRLLTTGMNINDLDDRLRSEALHSLKEAVDEAYEIGAKSIAFLSGKYSEEQKESHFQALVSSTLELCGYAQTKNMNVILEIFDYDIDKKSLIGPTHLAKRFAEEIRKSFDNFGLMVDLSHIPMYYETYESALESIKDYIAHVHIGNTVIRDIHDEGYGDTHPRFGFPKSENDIEQVSEFIKALFSIGYLKQGKRPIVSFEVKPWKNEDSELVIINAKRTLDQAWRQVTSMTI